MQGDAHRDDSGFGDVLVATLLDDALAADVRVLGIAGLQGSGKSTLAAQIATRAQTRGLRVAVLSLDDVYFDRDTRRALAHDVHPLLATRGPPGTHDLPLAFATLDALRDHRPIAIPRFDKARDRRLPQADWQRTDRVDLTVFEGWCLGTPAQPAEQLIAPINALELDDDADGRWRGYCNDALARDYPALWRRIDHLLWLHPPDFDIVATWRWQPEQARQAREPDAPRLTHAQVERFVQHFERVSRQALVTLPDIADTTIVLDDTRTPVQANPGATGTNR